MMQTPKLAPEAGLLLWHWARRWVMSADLPEIEVSTASSRDRRKRLTPTQALVLYLVIARKSESHRRVYGELRGEMRLSGAAWTQAMHELFEVGALVMDHAREVSITTYGEQLYTAVIVALQASTPPRPPRLDSDLAASVAELLQAAGALERATERARPQSRT